MDAARSPWDRREHEPSRSHELFRHFRDLGPLRTLEAMVAEGLGSRVAIQRLSARHDWVDRAQAWDEQVHRAEDEARLEAIRGMHERHQRAGRLALGMAIQALSRIDPEDIPPYAAARLLELGARLERDTLTVSVEELQGRTPAAPEDPWDAVARELDHAVP